eukprot:8130362-Alexandrium_andersonii.AAC.1
MPGNADLGWGRKVPPTLPRLCHACSPGTRSRGRPTARTRAGPARVAPRAEGLPHAARRPPDHA